MSISHSRGRENYSPCTTSLTTGWGGWIGFHQGGGSMLEVRLLHPWTAGKHGRAKGIMSNTSLSGRELRSQVPALCEVGPWFDVNPFPCMAITKKPIGCRFFRLP